MPKPNISDCGKLSSLKPEVANGGILELRFIPSTNKIPECLCLERQSGPKETTELCKKESVEIEGKVLLVNESRNNSEYVYTIGPVTPALAGRYLMRCHDIMGYTFSNELKISVTETAQVQINQ